jgi:hypothetical protein
MESRGSWAKASAHVLAFCLMVSALVYLFFGDTGIAQARRLAKIREYQATILPKVAADPRFKSIKLATVTSSGGGALFVQGTLATESDLEALKALIAATQPPAHVDYRVSIPSK